MKKLAISNIAWEKYNDEKILNLLHDHNVSGIELAPTKVWPEWKGINSKTIRQTKQFFDNHAFKVPAMQAILFGKPELQLFDVSSHEAFFEHFKILAEISAGLDCSVLVFGAPKNRRRFQLSVEEANDIAVDFFAKVGEIFSQNDVKLAIENNPVEYMCDYLTNVFDVENLVKKVDSKNVKVHFDSAGVHMCRGNLSKTIEQVNEFVHYHISEPMLEPIYENKVNHLLGLQELNRIDYKHWVSIEMKQTDSEYEDIERSLQFLNGVFDDII